MNKQYIGFLTTLYCIQNVIRGLIAANCVGSLPHIYLKREVLYSQERIGFLFSKES
jgi:hypothetical protein